VAGIVGVIKEQRPGERNMNAAALRFLDHIGATKLRRYTKGKPAYQLYAIRDHDPWNRKDPVDTMLAFTARHTARYTDDEADDFG
jgi:hypothetical protein